MKNLFLSSSFTDVTALFIDFATEILAGDQVAGNQLVGNSLTGNSLVGKSVTFIPTANVPEEYKLYVETAKQELEQLGIIVDELEVSTASVEEIDRKLRGNDFIYVSGGNTFYLLQELRKTGADKIIMDEIAKGKLYVGESAGSLIMAPNIEFVKHMDNVEAAPKLTSFDALHIVDFYPVPHHTNEPFVQAAEDIIKQYGEVLQLQPISNKQVILVEGDSVKVV
jgi:dipeptidase E